MHSTGNHISALRAKAKRLGGPRTHDSALLNHSYCLCPVTSAVLFAQKFQIHPLHVPAVALRNTSVKHGVYKQ